MVKVDLVGDELVNFIDAAAYPPDVLVISTDIEAVLIGGELGRLLTIICC